MDQSTDRSRQEHHKVVARMQKMPPVALVNLSQMRVKIIREGVMSKLQKTLMTV